MSKLKRCCPTSKFKPVTHCIFDLDGTILATEYVYKKVLKSLVEEYEGKVFPEEYHELLTGMPETDTLNKIIKDFQLPVELEPFRKHFREATDYLLADVDFMPGAVTLIKHLHEHGIPLAIGTSSPQDSADIKFSKKRDIFDLFHHVVCGGTDPEVIHGKPAPDTFLLAAKRFPGSPSPEKCLVFEDATNGVTAALSAGMQVVMIPDPSVPYESWKRATLRLDSLECMVPELFGLPPLPENCFTKLISSNDPKDKVDFTEKGEENEGQKIKAEFSKKKVSVKEEPKIDVDSEILKSNRSESDPNFTESDEELIDETIFNL
ncbi:probable pseudouridine-5'-phosphatase [Diabrotica undecimpunctata]|uniref:probable pseudouridine-5'-phosphatase n=1 Tax=Diabrotica undecimpunctata TaxID=50387 RepID=UPI003B636961